MTVTPVQHGLGTMLRHLLELLDGDVERLYREAGLNYRPRYTPVMQSLLRRGSTTIQDIARDAMITHSAASQTVSQMVRDELVYLQRGLDSRERIVHLTDHAQKLLPRLRLLWAATARAATRLDTELTTPLHQAVSEAIQALERERFLQRIRSGLQTSGRRKVEG